MQRSRNDRILGARHHAASLPSAMPAPYELLSSTWVLSSAGYFLVLVVAGAVSRLAFDFIAVMCFMALLGAWLASSGLDAVKVLAMLAVHVMATAGADRQVRRLARARRPRPGVEGGVQ